MKKPTFRSGKNIAMKVPAHQYEATVTFYRDILGFEPIELRSPDQFESISFKFGDKYLWIDCVSTLSQAEIWLEIETNDYQKAGQYFEANGVKRRDEIEQLPDGFKGFWISSPSSIIHLVCE